MNLNFKVFLAGWKKVASDHLDGLLITELELQIIFIHKTSAAFEQESGKFSTRGFPTHEIEYGEFSLSSTRRERQQRDAINVERIQIGKWFRKGCLIRAIIFP